jgi:hypothetical protein
LKHDPHRKADPLLEIVEECVRDGRRRNEIAAFLAREYGLDARAIARLIADHGAGDGAGRARRVGAAGLTALTALYLAVLSVLQRQAEEHGDMLPALMFA